MRVIAVANQKGGSSKTTVSVNLAAGLAEQGKRTLLIDIDPQANASQWFGVKDTGRGLLEVFVNNGNLYDIIHNTPFNVDVVPSSTWMIQSEKLLHGEVGAETILRRKLKLLDEKWDYVLIDCPPNLGILVINALVAANEVIVPVLAQILSVVGLSQLLETLEVVKDRINPNIHISGIVTCRYDARTRHSQEVVEILKDRFGDLVYKTVIRENIRIAEAPSFSQPVNIYDPHSRGAIDFRDLVKEIIAQEGTLS
ncbi:MAG: ParA family protein [Desulfomonilaceae bacterium]